MKTCGKCKWWTVAISNYGCCEVPLPPWVSDKVGFHMCVRKADDEMGDSCDLYETGEEH